MVVNILERGRTAGGEGSGGQAASATQVHPAGRTADRQRPIAFIREGLRKEGLGQLMSGNTPFRLGMLL